MFGRRKATKPAPAVGAPVEADPAGSSSTPTHEAMRAFNARMSTLLPEIQTLSQIGSAGVATISAVQLVADYGDNREFAVTGSVQAEDGSPFTATFPVLRTAVQPELEAGDTLPVLFDPNDHTRIVKRPERMAPKLRWRVPDLCPECGARVDQSTASLAEHPICHFCRAPLPVEPLTS